MSKVYKKRSESSSSNPKPIKKVKQNELGMSAKLMKDKIDALENEIHILSEEIAECEKKEMETKELVNELVSRPSSPGVTSALAEMTKLYSLIVQEVFTKKKEMHKKELELKDMKEKLESYDPLLLWDSPSSLAKTSDGQSIVRDHMQNFQQPLYFHPLALEMYEQITCGTNLPQDTDPSFQTLFNLKNLRSASTMYLNGAKPHGITEAVYSAILAHALDRYIIGDEKARLGAAVYHQLPTRKVEKKPGVPEASDIYILTLDENGLPDVPLLVSDVKIHAGDLDIAICETHLYCLTIFEKCPTAQLLLGLAVVPTHCCRLYLYRPCREKKHVHIIDLGQLGFDSEIKIMLKVLQFGILQLINKAMRPAVPNCEIVSCCEGKHRMLKGTHVVLCVSESIVYKYYDIKEDPEIYFNQFENVMMKLKGYKDKLQLGFQFLTKDKRFRRTKCRYIEQEKNQEVTEEQKKMLWDTLQEIHSQGYVHSDIRRRNILLDMNNNEAFFIDFDLCDEAGTQYPSRFNHIQIPERHEQARACMIRKKCHDEHSLSYILSNWNSS